MSGRFDSKNEWVFFVEDLTPSDLRIPDLFPTSPVTMMNEAGLVTSLQCAYQYFSSLTFHK